MPGWIVWHSSRQMNDPSFQKVARQESDFLFSPICNYIDLFIPVAILESDRLFYHAQSHQLAGDKGHTIWPGWNAALHSNVSISARVSIELSDRFKLSDTIYSLVPISKNNQLIRRLENTPLLHSQVLALEFWRPLMCRDFTAVMRSHAGIAPHIFFTLMRRMNS